MILKNKFYYCCLLLLLWFLILIDVFSFQVQSDVLLSLMIFIHLAFFFSLLLRNILAKPLLKIWLIAFVGLPTLFNISYGFYELYQNPKNVTIDFLWESIQLFIVILALATLDVALKIKRPSKVFVFKKRTRTKSQDYSLSSWPVKYAKLSLLYLRSRR